MKVLVDGRPLQDERSGGVRRLAEGLLPALQKNGDGIRWIVGTTGIRRPAGSESHIPLPNKLLTALFMSGLSSFDRHFETKEPDQALFFNLGFTGPIEIPYSLVVHDLSFLIEPDWFNLRGRLWHKLVAPKRMIKNAKHIFAVSKSAKRDLVTLLGIAPERIQVIPLGIDKLAEPKPPANLPPEKFVLVIGEGDPRKNMGTALEAAKRVGIHAVVTGKSGPNITSDAELAWLYQHAACFLYPSWYEGFGIPLHEAASFGTPIIASTANPLPETAPAGTQFAAPEKPHHWAAALQRTLERPWDFRTSSNTRTWDEAADLILSTIRS